MEKHEFNPGNGQYPEALVVLFENTVGYDPPGPLEIKTLEIGMKLAFDLGKTMVPDATVAGIQTGWDKYEELRATLEGLPATWYPALLGAMVRASYSRPVFVPGGASRFIANTEARIGHAAPAVPEGADPMTVIHIRGGTERHEYPIHRDVRALIDGLTGSIQVLRESVNRERAARIDPELARKTLSHTDRGERAFSEMVDPENPTTAQAEVAAGLMSGRLLAEAILAKGPAPSGPSRITPADLAAAAETTALPRKDESFVPGPDSPFSGAVIGWGELGIAAVLPNGSQAVAETSEQPMDATNMIVLGMLGIERMIGSLASHQPEEVAPVLEQAREVAREIRLALSGEDKAAGIMAQLAQAMKAIIDAEQELADAVLRQWNGKTALNMSIPARPDRDSDLIIADAMAKARSLIFPGVRVRMAAIRPKTGSAG